MGSEGRTRICSVCGQSKELNLFPKQRTLCKVCHNLKTNHLKTKWKLNNPDKVLEDRIRRADIHKEIAKEHYKQNKSRYNELSAAYAKRNKAIVNANSSKYRAHKLQATPQWADLDLIKDVYMEAEYMQLAVDHIYPLQGKTVCGLHVWENLQLLPKSTNSSKYNTMPTEEYVSCLS